MGVHFKLITNPNKQTKASTAEYSAERPAEYSASRKFSQIFGWYADFALSRLQQITLTLHTVSVWEHLLIQLLLLFELRDYNLFGLNSFSLCIVIILSRGDIILLFRAHHKSILPLETFFERLGGRGLHGNISLRNSRIFRLRNCQKNLSQLLKKFIVHINLGQRRPLNLKTLAPVTRFLIPDRCHSHNYIYCVYCI